jgi:hypothetical protein
LTGWIVAAADTAAAPACAPGGQTRRVVVVVVMVMRIGPRRTVRMRLVVAKALLLLPECDAALRKESSRAGMNLLLLTSMFREQRKRMRPQSSAQADLWGRLHFEGYRRGRLLGGGKLQNCDFLKVRRVPNCWGSAMIHTPTCCVSTGWSVMSVGCGNDARKSGRMTHDASFVHIVWTELSTGVMATMPAAESPRLTGVSHSRRVATYSRRAPRRTWLLTTGG